MKNASVASMITVSEETRRAGYDEDVQHGRHGYECLATGDFRLKCKPSSGPGNKEGENTVKICEQLYDLASLAHGQLSPERMTNFVKRSNDIMMICGWTESRINSTQ